MIPNVQAARDFVKSLKDGTFVQVRGSLISYPGEVDHPMGEEKACYCAEGVFVLTALGGDFKRRKAVYTLNGQQVQNVGFLDEAALISVFGEWVPIRSWNDAYHWTFEEIADTLEQRFPEIKA